MKIFQFSKLGMKSRILLLTVIPLFVITTVLTSYLIVSRQNDARQELLLHGGTAARYLSKVSEIAMFAGDTDTLRSNANAAMTGSDVRGVTFFDEERRVILRAGKHLKEQRIVPQEGFYRESRGSRWLFQVPIIESEISVDDYALDDTSRPHNTEPVNLGWVQVMVDESNLHERERSILLTGLSIGSAGFVILIFLALKFAQSITRPLAGLSKTVAQLEAGHLDTRVHIDAEGEIGVLVKGINRLAEQVEKSSEQLKSEVEQATRQLKEAMQSLERQNVALEDTSSELIAANSAKDEFLARMSHELRTPLTSVLGYCRLLSKTPLEGDQKEYIHIVNQASSLLLSTIDDILDFSKLQSDAIQLEQTPFNLEEVLDDILAMHAYAIQTKGLELILLIETDVPVKLIGDSLRLRQIINNLVSNAVKFTNSGYVAVTVSLIDDINNEASCISLEFSVKDSGIGIDKEAQARMFEAFSQADTSTSRRYGGTGLGLVISKKLVGLMDGQISVNSKKGAGTEILFTMCCDTQVYEPKSIQLPSANAREALIFDANDFSRRAIRNHLIDMGMSVSVRSKEEGIAEYITASSREFSLLILSLSSDQWKTLEWVPLLNIILAGYRGATLVISGLTAEEWKQSSKQVDAPGELAHLSKPISRTSLQNKVRSLFGRGSEEIPVVPEKNPTPDMLRGLSVVVAEDNQFNRSLFVKILNELGARVLEAEDGKKAVALCRQGDVNLLIIDLHMPVMDGIEASQKLRETGLNIPILALTADVVADKTKMLKEVGVDNVIYKPVDEGELIGSVLKLTGMSSNNFVSESRSKPLLARLPYEEVIAEIKRLVEVLTEASESGELEQVQNIAHQLRGIAAAKDSSQEINAIAESIEKGLLEYEVSDLEIKLLVEKLNSIDV